MTEFLFGLLRAAERHLARLQGRGYGYGAIRREVAGCIKLLNGAKLGIFVDIGANIGLYTEEILRQTHCRRCFLFEPAAANTVALREKFSADIRVTISGLALSNTNAVAVLYADKPGSRLSSLAKRHLDHANIAFDHRETVQVKRFDDWWAMAPDYPDLVKIDVEGHEMGVLEGFGDILKKVKLVQFEFGGCNIDTRTFFKDFWIFFSEMGFEIFIITPFGPRRIGRYSEEFEFYSTTNFIARNMNVFPR